MHRPTGRARESVDGPPAAPDIVGLGVLEAHAAARQLGLHLSVSVWETKLGPWGLFLSQRPEPGARVRVGTRIEAVVAGRPYLAVPDVVGLAGPAAIESLRRMGLQPIITAERASRTVDAGAVVLTRPSAGSLVVHGSRVSLVISRGHAAGRAGRRPSSG